MRITSRHLRQIIREELLREGPGPNNPGSGFEKSRSAQVEERKKKLGAELTKTYQWFKDYILPSVEKDEWNPPVVANRNYLVSANSRYLSPEVPLGDPSTAGLYIEAGTEFTSTGEEYLVSDRWREGPEGVLVRSLRVMYDELEKSAEELDLPTQMESFPD